jgi:hypothetical protein
MTDKLRAKIEASTQAHVLAEATRMNRAAASSTTAPTAEVMAECFETPDAVWPAAKVRTVAQSLHKDYLRLLLPYIDVDTRTIARAAPTDDDLRATLVASSQTYKTFAQSNQHATWFKFYTDRTRTNGDRETVAELFELRVAVETGQLTEDEAKQKLSASRAGVLAKARALENVDKLKDAGIHPTRKQIKDTQHAVKLMKAEDAAAAAKARRVAARAGGAGGAGVGGAGGAGARRRAVSPATLVALQARAAALQTRTQDTQGTQGVQEKQRAQGAD